MKNETATDVALKIAGSATTVYRKARRSSLIRSATVAVILFVATTPPSTTIGQIALFFAGAYATVTLYQVAKFVSDLRVINQRMRNMKEAS